MYGHPFEREQTLTAVAVPGGDHWTPNDPPRDVLCEVLDCLRQTGVINADLLRRLEAMGLNLGALLKCLGNECHRKDERPQR